MTRDYAKYTKHQGTKKHRPRRGLWIMLLGITLGLFILGGWLLKFSNRPLIIQPQVGDQNLKRKGSEIPPSKPPEPRFDFYSVLPQGKLDIPSQVISPSEKSTVSDENKVLSVASSTKVSLDTVLNITPEQVAVETAKKALEHELRQLDSQAVYVLVLGDFTEVNQAEQLQVSAQLKGFPVQREVALMNRKLIYRIFVGPYSARDEAIQQQRNLSRADIRTILVRVDS